MLELYRCQQVKFIHNGQYTIKCANCKRVGHLTRDCKSPATTNNQRNLTCYECGNQGHYRSDCPESKNQNHGNQAEVDNRGTLKVSPWKGEVRLGKRGKLNPRVHNTFHVSNLKKCYTDEPLAVPLDGLHIDNKRHFSEEPAEIMVREVKRLKQSRIPIVKVR
ncbi:putative reverse transcriptase domain-containing protein [Tanacetum coccineum]|uniref:Reverse transcriptase domain-containing protein n=1 Tax=Tanacetum coccineum TaxID=301880 RepID=A0ABQ4XHV9_9ASTR